MTARSTKDERRTFVADLIGQGKKDRDIAILYTQRFGAPITADQVYNFRTNDYPKLKKRTDAVDKIKEGLPKDAETLDGLLLTLLARVADEPSNKDLTLLVKEARQIIQTKHQMAQAADPSQMIFVVEINGTPVSTNDPSLIIDAEPLSAPQLTEGLPEDE